VRGKKRYLFDFNFKLPFEVSISGGGVCEGSYEMNDISNDEDYEVRTLHGPPWRGCRCCAERTNSFVLRQISCRLSKQPSSASEQSAVQAFVAKKKSGLQKELARLIGVFAHEFQQQ